MSIDSAILRTAADSDFCTKRARFSFELINIEPGEEVEFWYTYKNPSGIMCKVLDDRHIEYDGKSWSLSGLARHLTNAKNCVPGPHYFKYKGEWLNEIRTRLGVKTLPRKARFSISSRSILGCDLGVKSPLTWG